MDLKAAALDVAQILTGAGVAATVDYRDLPVPGVLIVPDTAAYDRLSDDAGTVGFRLVGVAGNADPFTALQQLGDLLGACQTVTDLAEITFTTYQNSNISADVLPAFTAQITCEWEK